MFKKYSLKKVYLKYVYLKSLILIFLININLLLLNINSIKAIASSPWTQTDWSGGSGQTNWSDNTKFESSSNVTTSVAGQITLSPTSGWCNNSYCNSTWKYRNKITFDNTDTNLGVTSENLTNFPVLIKLSSSNIDYSKTNNDGSDIRFTDSDGSDLAYEIEKWDETGTSFVWVKVPQIDANSSTDYIYMYYGNTSATDHQQVTSVWDSNYVLVQHLSETSGTTTNDSTSNNNDGNKVSATEPNPTASGRIDGAQDFDGGNDYIYVSHNSSLNLTSAFTAEAWFNLDTLPLNDMTLIGKGTFGDSDPNGQQNYFLALANNDFGLTGRNLVGGFENSTGTNFQAYYNFTHTTGTWYYAVVTYSSGTQTVTLYQNGSQVAQLTNVTATPFTNSEILTIGRLTSDNPTEGLVDGRIDEVRISNTARSPAWIAATYNLAIDNFNTFSSEEQVYSIANGTLTSSIFDTESSSGALWGTLTYTATTPSNTSISVRIRTSNSSSMSGASSFSSCNPINSGSDISSNNCVTDSHRYIQYQITLSNTDSISTPTFEEITINFSAYDVEAPVINLSPLTPDPHSDNTPVFNGSVSDSIGTVADVEFQIDSTSGSWENCSSNDGSFDESQEDFSCIISSALSEGLHTIYIRASDSNGNTTSSGNEASDSFTIDTQPPKSISLDSPEEKVYTNSERPIFKWKTTSDETTNVIKYILEIDNPSLGTGNPSGDFTIDNIKPSGNSDYETPKYFIRYENFFDSDEENNYISVFTKSSTEWSNDSNTGQNDGKLREGKVTWKVKAIDTAGNEVSTSRTLFVDRTPPKFKILKINDSQIHSGEFSTFNKTLTLYGEIVDLLAGGDPNQIQDENGPRVASGPKEVNITIEKKEGIFFKPHLSYKIQLEKSYLSCDNTEIKIIPNKNCDKYTTFLHNIGTLNPGTYKITFTAKDNAGNQNQRTLTLNIWQSIIKTNIPPVPSNTQKTIPEEKTIPQLKPKITNENNLEYLKKINSVAKRVIAIKDKILTWILFLIRKLGEIFNLK